jgi:hypothetical protein
LAGVGTRCGAGAVGLVHGVLLWCQWLMLVASLRGWLASLGLAVDS